MTYDKELTLSMLGDVGPLRFNPKVVKICQKCNTPNIVRYKGAHKPSTPYYCRKCVVNRDEVKQKLSASTKKQWENPKFAELVKENSRNIWNDKNRREQMSKVRTCPEIKLKIIQFNKTRHYDSKKISKLMISKWKDVDYRQRLLSKISKTRRTTDEVVQQFQSKHGDRFDYAELDYINSHTKVKVKCAVCGTRFYTFVHNHVKNGSCPKCQVSVGHRQIIDFIQSLGNYKISINNRTKINPLELDIYLDDLDFAIEYHGLFHHSYDRNPLPKEKLRHQNKALICRDQNIKLLQILSHEWDTKQSIVKSMIRHNLGITEYKIYARNCLIDTTVNQSFFNTSHLQGYRAAQITISLTYNNEIVSSMSFSRHNQYQWEIIRYATKPDMVIVGGASRLFSNFIKIYNPTTVMTYADLRHSWGNIYQSLGFVQADVTKPNYFYTDKYAIFSRQSFQKHKLSKKLPKFDPTKSEIINCLNNDLRILYDAGHLKFLWHKDHKAL